jgi:hypothetical protein
LAYEINDCYSGAAFGVRPLVVEDPGEDVDDCGVDACGGEVDGDVAGGGGRGRGEDDVACCAEEGEGEDYEAWRGGFYVRILLFMKINRLKRREIISLRWEGWGEIIRRGG